MRLRHERARAHPALCESGIDVIVTDHHLPGGPLPECFAVLNPKRPGSDYPDKDLAAVGVAFKLMLALAEKLGGNANFVYNMLDLVALATIADVAPLRGENRDLRAVRSQADGRDAARRACARSCARQAWTANRSPPAASASSSRRD